MTTNTDSVPSISIQIDSESRNQIYRRSLQPQSKAPVPIHPVRRHSSLGKNRSSNNIKKPSVPVIPETEKSDDDDSQQNDINTSPSIIESNRISFKKTSRKISNISRTSKTSVQSQVNNDRGFVNYAYDQSTQSSMHGSMSSLPVIHEQYCCCSRWTRLEKNLAFIVAVLAIIIIALVIAVGIVAKHEGQNDFVPRYMSVFKL